MFKPFMLALCKKSPLKSLQMHMAIALEAAQCLEPFFTALMAGDWDEVGALRQKIELYEGRADQCKRKLRLTLHRDIMSSLPRSDMLALISIQDGLANKAKHISGLVCGRKMVVPKSMHALFMQYIKGVVATCVQAETVLSELNQLVSSGFSGALVEMVERHIKKLGKMEQETDDLQIKIRLKLFALEGDLEPIAVMFLYQVIEAIGALADCAENVGDRALLLLAS
jgi:uncharacterized protein